MRPFPRGMDRQQAALTFDHDTAHIGSGRRNQRHPAGATCLDFGMDEFSARAGLAESATGKNKPITPCAFRGALVGPSVFLPVEFLAFLEPSVALSE